MVKKSTYVVTLSFVWLREVSHVQPYSGSYVPASLAQGIACVFGSNKLVQIIVLKHDKVMGLSQQQGY